MAGPDDRPTTGLLTAVRYLKDNRLLPAGFDKTTAPADVAVVGPASSDADFLAGRDDVRYAVDAGTGPLQIQVRLLFQPISFRWADNLRAYDAPEPRRFLRYWDAMAHASSLPLTTASASVP